MAAAREAWESVLSPAGSQAVTRLDAALAEQGLGTLFSIDGHHNEGLHFLGSASEALRGLGELSHLLSVESNIGASRFWTGNVASAKEAWNRASKVAEKLGDVENALVAKNNIACALQEEGNHEGAIEIFRKIQTAVQAGAPPHFMLAALAGSAESLLALNLLDDAMRDANECLALACVDNDSTQKCWSERVMGEVLNARGEIHSAEACFDRAATLAKKNGDKYELEKIAALRRNKSEAC
jgi:tetratricopeptide (TPR) repeat protein